MKKLFIIAAALPLLLLASCNKENDNLFIGTWSCSNFHYNYYDTLYDFKLFLDADMNAEFQLFKRTNGDLCHTRRGTYSLNSNNTIATVEIDSKKDSHKKDAESKSGNAQPGTMPWPWVEQNIITTTFYYESEVLLYWPEENIHLIKQ